MSVPQGSFDRMTEMKFVPASVAANVSLSPSQAEVASLEPTELAVVFGAPGVGKTVAAVLEGGAKVLKLTDNKGRRFIVPTESLAYVEIGAEESRRVGFIA